MSYETHRRLLAELASHPRGHWAIYHNGEGFDSWMSNGVGGTTTESGHKFQHKQADHPFISFERVYASVFSTMSYYRRRSEEHTSELQSLMRISYAVFCLKKKNTTCI